MALLKAFLVANFSPTAGCEMVAAATYFLSQSQRIHFVTITGWFFDVFFEFTVFLRTFICM